MKYCYTWNILNILQVLVITALKCSILKVQLFEQI